MALTCTYAVGRRYIHASDRVPSRRHDIDGRIYAAAADETGAAHGVAYAVGRRHRNQRCAAGRRL